MSFFTLFKQEKSNNLPDIIFYFYQNKDKNIFRNYKKRFIMKKALLLILVVFAAIGLQAQCTPDPIYQDSAIGVYPAPFKEDRPSSGIPDTACVNEYFDFTITFKVPPNIMFSGFPVDINSIVLATTGGVNNLPEGLSYACNPPTCIFVPEDTLSCVNIFGTPSNPDDVGVHDLTIDATVNTSITSLPIVLPDNSGVVEGADGNYYLHVRAEGDCMTTSTENLFSDVAGLKNIPNPFGYETLIEVTVRTAGVYDFEVFDIIGNRVSNQKINLHTGVNNIPFVAENMTNGIYTYTLSNGNGRIAAKMVVQR